MASRSSWFSRKRTTLCSGLQLLDELTERDSCAQTLAHLEKSSLDRTLSDKEKSWRNVYVPSQVAALDDFIYNWSHCHRFLVLFALDTTRISLYRVANRLEIDSRICGFNWVCAPNSGQKDDKWLNTLSGYPSKSRARTNKAEFIKSFSSCWQPKAV